MGALSGVLVGTHVPPGAQIRAALLEKELGAEAPYVSGAAALRLEEAGEEVDDARACRQGAVARGVHVHAIEEALLGGRRGLPRSVQRDAHRDRLGLGHMLARLRGHRRDAVARGAAPLADAALPELPREAQRAGVQRAAQVDDAVPAEGGLHLAVGAAARRRRSEGGHLCYPPPPSLRMIIPGRLYVCRTLRVWSQCKCS